MTWSEGIELDPSLELKESTKPKIPSKSKLRYRSPIRGNLYRGKPSQIAAIQHKGFARTPCLFDEIYEVHIYYIQSLPTVGAIPEMAFYIMITYRRTLTFCSGVVFVHSPAQPLLSLHP